MVAGILRCSRQVPGYVSKDFTPEFSMSDSDAASRKPFGFEPIFERVLGRRRDDDEMSVNESRIANGRMLG